MQEFQEEGRTRAGSQMGSVPCWESDLARLERRRGRDAAEASGRGMAAIIGLLCLGSALTTLFGLALLTGQG